MQFVKVEVLYLVFFFVLCSQVESKSVQLMSVVFAVLEKDGKVEGHQINSIMYFDRKLNSRN